MASELRSFARLEGARSTLGMGGCMLIELKAEYRAIDRVHPLHGRELRALRPLHGKSPYVFVTEAGTPVTTAWFLRMIQRTGKAAKLPFPVHPHMLRHSTDYKLANQGEDTRSLAHYLY